MCTACMQVRSVLCHVDVKHVQSDGLGWRCSRRQDSNQAGHGWRVGTGSFSLQLYRPVSSARRDSRLQPKDSSRLLVGVCGKVPDGRPGPAMVRIEKALRITTRAATACLQHSCPVQLAKIGEDPAFFHGPQSTFSALTDVYLRLPLPLPSNKSPAR